MPSIQYKQVYEKFYLKVTAYDLIYNNLTDAQNEELLCSYLRSSLAYPMIRKLFSTLTLDNDAGEFTYTMRYVVDENSDREFILDLLGAELAVKWVEPKLKNWQLVEQNYSTSEQKFYSQANQITALTQLYQDMENQVRRLIADRGGQFNTYLDGTSATATMRTS